MFLGRFSHFSMFVTKSDNMSLFVTEKFLKIIIENMLIVSRMDLFLKICYQKSLKILSLKVTIITFWTTQNKGWIK